ncbi:OprD family porin [[Pseudomonas] boreopolis]|uniref:Porin n=1 Tax=Xanthomonas boreopolis TaxID=86183 RepID=A0A919KL51_9XANT|nr:porin [[Pseudomonas] boreopolis]
MRIFHCACAASLALLAVQAKAEDGFLAGASADLTATNYYFNRDFRSGAGQGKREEWAQGFIVDAKSGYTPGAVGFGVDLLALSAFKLDGVSYEEGTGILPTDEHGARHALLHLAPAAKLRFADSVLRVGADVPNQPILRSSTSRLLPQTFQGASLRSRDVAGLDLLLARYTRSWYREGTGNVPLTITNKNDRFAGTPDSDHFDMFSAQYALTPNVSLRYQAGELDQIYRQQLFNLLHRLPLWGGSLNSDIRYFDSTGAGASRAGAVDNRMWNVHVGWEWRGQEWGASYQRLDGATGMPWVGGTDADVFTWTNISDFMERDERSWRLRYTLDGDKAGLPGFKAMLRYIHADHARPATRPGEGREWARDLDLMYSFRQGALKHLSVRWVYSVFRSNFARDADENRIILQYKIPLYGS